ncbi:MAG: translation elongation factor Ts [Gammaproteobacteria bacterium]
MEIKAALVKELRERTGAGMMECKKALQACAGDLEAAIQHLRKAGLAKAAKRTGKVAAEGVVVMREMGQTVAMVEVNCETDFVAKGDDFSTFCEAVANVILQKQPADAAALMRLSLGSGESDTVEERQQQLAAKIGEKIAVRRFEVRPCKGTPGVYSHGNRRIGVIVDLEGGDTGLAKEIAMHVAASRPVCVNETEVPPELVEKEKEVLIAQAENSGKPAAIIEKMVQGRLKKFFAEVTLLGQPFVKDPEVSVSQLLKEAGARVHSFTRFEVGEGLEKKAENFAAEVMAQVKGT